MEGRWNERHVGNVVTWENVISDLVVGLIILIYRSAIFAFPHDWYKSWRFLCVLVSCMKYEIFDKFLVKDVAKGY